VQDPTLDPTVAPVPKGIEVQFIQPNIEYPKIPPLQIKHCFKIVASVIKLQLIH